MYFWLGLCLSLAALLFLNALASLGSAALWRVLAVRAENWRARDRARAIFALRLAPILGATFFVGLLLLPSYWAHEPRGTNESVGWPLLLLAFLSFVGLALALWRGIATWRATRRLTNEWLQSATSVELPGVTIPTFRLRHPFPVVAVVGIWRPRLFIAEQLFDQLSAGELTATLDHELGHIATHDNLKRTILRACSDVLTIVPCGRGLDRAWAESAECAADEHAARQGDKVSLDLAAALVKIARLVPPGRHSALPLGAYLLTVEENNNNTVIAHRVRRLAALATRPAQAYPLRIDLAVWSGLGGFFLFLLFAAWHSTALMTLHSFLERVVSL